MLDAIAAAPEGTLKEDKLHSFATTTWKAYVVVLSGKMSDVTLSLRLKVPLLLRGAYVIVSCSGGPAAVYTMLIHACPELVI